MTSQVAKSNKETQDNIFLVLLTPLNAIILLSTVLSLFRKLRDFEGLYVN
jgi:hypothetical protein